MKEYWNNTWNYLEGKKTMIGFMLLWVVEKPWLKELLPAGSTGNAIVDILAYAGAIFAGVGLADKGYKAFQERKSN